VGYAARKLAVILHRWGSTELERTQPAVLGYNRPGAKVSEGVRESFWLQGMMAGFPAATFAKNFGMPPEMIDAVISGLPASFGNEREQVIYEMTSCLDF
jgi:hypothetical protein